jgi:hypothetical protein
VRIAISYRAFTDGKNRSHFLLKETTLACRASLVNGAIVDVPATRGNRADLAFTIDLTPALLPIQMTRLEVTFDAPITLDGRTFSTLRIGQTFSPTPIAPDGIGRAEYNLTPAGWRDSLSRLRVSNLATHPLVDASQLATRKLVLNALILDLTEAWLHLHRRNPNYVRYQLLSAQAPSTFKVLAHLGGNPLVWYIVVPSHLKGASMVSPHVFYSPADNTEAQNDYNDERYLKSNARHFDEDGSTLFNYLTAPVPDVDVRALKQTVPIVETLRNVVGFAHAVNPQGRRTGAITTKHWRIGAGFQKAFEPIGGGKPAQILLMPQRMEGGSNGWAITGHLKAATDAVVDLLQTNTLLLSGAADIIVSKGKMVLSAYSESGFDLWFAALANQDLIKAIVAIEPQNLNSIQNDYRTRDEDKNLVNPKEQAPLIGKDVIPILLKKQVAVFIIGRHHLHYRPQIPDLSKVRLLPVHPQVVLAYPPDPARNDFVKYRVNRVIAPASDPFMLTEEKAVLAELGRRGISGNAALAAIFTKDANRDKTLPGTGLDTWYSHQFALSGGDEMKLDPAGIYDKPVTYRTFFASAVDEIG